MDSGLMLYEVNLDTNKNTLSKNIDITLEKEN